MSNYDIIFCINYYYNTFRFFLFAELKNSAGSCVLIPFTTFVMSIVTFNSQLQKREISITRKVVRNWMMDRFIWRWDKMFVQNVCSIYAVFFIHIYFVSGSPKFVFQQANILSLARTSWKWSSINLLGIASYLIFKNVAFHIFCIW